MLIVEDGTGLPDANSYASVQQADLHYNMRGVKEWLQLEEETKQQLLIQATDYIDIRFKYAGEQSQPTQSLQFPRNLFGFPNNVVKACIEYALRANSGPLAPDIESDASGLQVTGKTEKVGPLEESFNFKEAVSVDAIQQFKLYPQTDALLQPYTGSRFSGRRVVR